MSDLFLSVSGFNGDLIDTFKKIEHASYANKTNLKQ